MRSIFFLLLACCFLSTNLSATIIGEDNRQATTKDDGEAAGIGIVFASFNGKKDLFKCTGTLIGQHFILTAAHCVFRQGKGGFAREISFLPGFKQEIKGEGSDKYRIKSLWVARQFVSAEENGQSHSWYTDRSDIAVLEIKQQAEPFPGNLFGFKQLSDDFDSLVQDQKYLGNLVSYPIDKPHIHGPWKETGCQYWTPDAAVFYTNCDTFIGSSGGALLTQYNKIIGVISSFSKNRNYATRITAIAAKEISAIVQGEGHQAEYFTFNNLADTDLALAD